MTIKVRRKEGQMAARPPKAAAGIPPGLRIGEWARVVKARSEDCSIDVITASGAFLKHVPVASREWSAPLEGGGHSGERDLPPVNARVFVLMPSLSFSDCFALPFSGHSVIDRPAPFMDAGEEGAVERIEPSGWRSRSDRGSGSRRIESPDGKTFLDVSYEGGAGALELSLFDDVKITVGEGKSAVIEAFDATIEIKSGSASVKTKNLKIEADGELSVKTSGPATIHSPKAKITGGTFEVGGSVAPTGSGPLCALAFCVATGAPQTGSVATGT